MQNKPFTLHAGDSLEVLRGMPDNSVDAVVTDPPYGLKFMGKRWDYDVPATELWVEVLRVLKPGGHLLAFAGTRTQHRMAVRIEDAGFEIRDMIAWVYGSGFPKSLDVSKAIDKEAGAEREVVGFKVNTMHDIRGGNLHAGVENNRIPSPITASATPEAAQWQGWGTALKPALEPITLARKPFSQTVAANVLEWGTGGLNVDGCRVGTTKEVPGAVKTGRPIASDTWLQQHGHGSGYGPRQEGQTGMDPNIGRWPANLIHDGSEEVVGLFPRVKTGVQAAHHKSDFDGVDKNCYGKYAKRSPGGYGDDGSAARFFYCAKTSPSERRAGVDTNDHPTVKPTALMSYLCRLITPPGGLILDPFMGSGSTGRAAMLEGFQFIGVDLNQDYVELSRARIQHALDQSKQGALPFAAE